MRIKDTYQDADCQYSICCYCAANAAGEHEGSGLGVGSAGGTSEGGWGAAVGLGYISTDCTTLATVMTASVVMMNVMLGAASVSAIVGVTGDGAVDGSHFWKWRKRKEK